MNPAWPICLKFLSHSLLRTILSLSLSLLFPFPSPPLSIPIYISLPLLFSFLSLSLSFPSPYSSHLFPLIPPISIPLPALHISFPFLFLPLPPSDKKSKIFLNYRKQIFFKLFENCLFRCFPEIFIKIHNELNGI